jgi:DNA polymerase-3 subunit epsilon
MLQLRRPIAFIDADSTGPDPRSARIVRLTVLKLHPDGAEQLRSVLFNPGEPISPGATDSHGLTDDDVADAPPFRAYARSLAAHIEGCDLAGFGIERFDIPLLEAEFKRTGSGFSLQGRAVVDTMAIFHRLEPRDLSAAYRRYAGSDLPDTREADTTVRAALDIFRGQLRAADVLPRDPAAIHGWLRQDEPAPVDPEGKFAWSVEGEIIINFGRYRGHRLANLKESQPDYLEWLAANDEFSADVRRIAASALEGDIPRRE